MKKIFLSVVILFLSINLFSQKFEDLAMTPPMGWNSWNKFGCDVSETMIKRMADAMVQSGLVNVGYQYIIIDDCWQTGRDAEGNILADSLRFPSGMKSLAEYVHSKGLKFGIYSCVGEKTCAGRPGGRGHEYQDALMYASWGVDYLKYDFCFHEKLNAEGAYQTMRDALYAAKRPVVFSICEWGSNQPWLWAKDIGNLWRTSKDIYPCTNCDGDFKFGWLNILEEQVPLWKYAGPGHWNDPDMLEVGNAGMNFQEARSHYTMWCMLAAPLILGNDLSSMSQETLSILSNREVIGINQDPLGKQAYRYLTNEGVDIWVKPLSEQRYAIAILNKNKNSATLEFSWKWWGKCFFAESPQDEDYQIYNVYEKKKMGTTEVPFEAKLDGRDVTLLIMSKM
jgi:alpha-galactosidase